MRNSDTEKARLTTTKHNNSIVNEDANSDESKSTNSDSDEDEEAQPTVMEEIRGTWNLLIDPRMRKFIPLCTWTALSLAIY
jgi:hypothetical protein